VNRRAPLGRIHGGATALLLVLEEYRMRLQWRMAGVGALVGLLALGSGCSRLPWSDSARLQQSLPATEEGLAKAVDLALAAGKRKGKFSKVDRSDLLALALVPAGGNISAECWVVDGFADGTMRGDSRFGPWRMPLDMARRTLGAEYGINPSWSDDEVARFIMERPVVQASLAADRLQRLYLDFGPRSPLALQVWLTTAIPANPDNWRQEVARLDSDAVPFARRILLGDRSEPRGLLYWLAVDSKEQELKQTLVMWKAFTRFNWETGQRAPIRLNEKGSMPVRPAEIEILRPFRREHAMVNRLAAEAIATP